MGELNDASSGRVATSTGAEAAPAAPPAREEPAATKPPADGAGAPAPALPTPAAQPAEQQVRAPGTGGRSATGDLDGARLIALNMALNGESREDTDRYLAENFELADRGKLVDEVYAAIEG
jgi:hypothetical protein